MTTNEKYQQLRDAFAADVQRIATSRYYSHDGNAFAYLSRDVAPIWGEALSVEADDVVKIACLAPSVLRVLHFFGRAMHRKASGKSRAPLVQSLPPSRAGGVVRTQVAYPKASIAKVCGLTVRTVEAAISTLGGRRGKDDMLVTNKLCCPQFLDAGIIIDGIFSRQLAWPFLYDSEVYTESTNNAMRARVGMGSTANKIIAWNRVATSPQEEQLDMPLAPVTSIVPPASEEERAPSPETH